MATVTSVRTEILTRIRDVEGTAHDDVFLAVLSDCQRLVNACYGGVLADADLALTPGQTVYTFGDIEDDVVRPIAVTWNAKVLRRTPWQEIKDGDPRWLNSEGSPCVWDTLGHNLLFIVPSPALTAPLIATVKYIVELPELLIDDDMAVPEQYVAAVMDLVVEVLLLRQRLFPSIAEGAASFTRHSNPRIAP